LLFLIKLCQTFRVIAKISANHNLAIEFFSFVFCKLENEVRSNIAVLNQGYQMNFLTGFLRTIILLGAVQGFIISSLLFFSKKSRQSSRILSKLIFLMALASFKLYGSMQGWFDHSDVMRVLDAIIPMIIVMPFGPLIFFYMKSVLDPDFKLNKKDRIHFYPVIIDLVPQIMAIIYLLALIFGLIKNNYKPFGVSLGTVIDNYNVYADIPRWISVSTYLMLSARFLSN